MNRMTKRIDFKNGITPDIINDNFECLENDANKTRIATAGTGILSGLEISYNDTEFYVSINSGNIVDNFGDIISIDSKLINIDKPVINRIKEDVIISSDGIIELNNIPYKSDCSGADVYASSITVRNAINKIIEIPVSSVSGKLLTVDKRYSLVKAEISYNVVHKYIVSIFINEDSEINYANGKQSSSPSIPNIEDFKFLICNIIVDPFFVYDDGLMKPKIIVSKESTNYYKRPIYVDKDNNLYLCGKKYESVSSIQLNNFDTDQKDNTISINTEDNSMCILKNKKWIIINNFSSEEVRSKNIIKVKDNNQKLFMFDYNDIDIRFSSNKNNVDVLVDNVLLHKDQYQEVYASMIMKDDYLKDSFLNNGYPLSFLSNVNEEYENTGFGIYIPIGLDKGSCVEVSTRHSVISPKSNSRLQKEASFISRYNTNIEPGENDLKVVELGSDFLKGNHQLNIFLNRSKLIENVDYIEGESNDGSKNNESINSITIIKSIPINSMLSYDIVKNIFSYDNIDKISYNIKEQVESIESWRSTADSSINNNKLSYIDNKNEIDVLKNKNPAINKFSFIITKTSDEIIIPDDNKFNAALSFYSVISINNNITNVLVENDSNGFTLSLNEQGEQVINLSSAVLNDSKIVITGFSII